MPTIDFKGKPFVYSHHLSVPFRELTPIEDKSHPVLNSPSLDNNLVIHGDNLHALKALLPKYAGRIDIIYIDPPYNTGNEGWAYNDNVNSPLMKEWLGKVVDGEDLERHDKWLCMMWPRLMLLNELLSEDGFIFVSMDESEYATLKMAMDEIFTRELHVGTFVWKRRTGSMDERGNFSKDHDYVLAYQKGNRGLLGNARTFDKYTNPDNDIRGEWIRDNLSASKPGGDTYYAFKNPTSGEEYWPPKGRFWPYNPETMQKKIREGRILFPNALGGSPMLKRFKSEARSLHQPISSWIESKKSKEGVDEEGVLHLSTPMNSSATKSIKEIFGDKVFNYSKPSILIQKLIAQIDNPNAIILDSFAGSGATGEAVLALNKKDGGNRKFILVEMEDYAHTITAERVRRVMQGVPNAKDDALKNGLGGSFTYCDLGDPIDMESFFGESASMPAYDQLARYIAYTATGEAMDKAPTKPAKDWFIGEVGGVRLHLIYKPDGAFMKSHEAALDMDTVKTIAAGNKTGKPSYVFAAAKYMGQTELTRDYDMTFCQLPYAIHRIMGDGVDG